MVLCPYRVDRRCLVPICFADHNAMILTMKISNEKQGITKDGFSGWKLTPEHIEKYKEQMNTRCCKYQKGNIQGI